jgi:tetratricopeptide (TPR) repeat protein
MKKERRHELHTNALADWLGGALEQAKPYQNALLGATLLVVVGIVVVAVWYNHSVAAAADAWVAMRSPIHSPSEQDLRRITTEYAGSPAAQWAQVSLGDLFLGEGTPRLFENKAMAQELLSQALNSYRAAYEAADAPLLRERALFGMARTQEALGRLDEAAKTYEELNRQWPEGMFHTAAADRLKDLKRNETKAFYDRFAAFNPKPPAPKEPPAAKGAMAPLPENPPDEAAKKKAK